MNIFSPMILSLSLFGSFRAVAGEAPPTAASEVATIEDRFASGDYSSATHDANKLLIHDELLPASSRLRLYLVKARLEVAFDRTGELNLWLGKAQALDPDLSFDPVKDPPALLMVWRELQRDR